MKVENSKAQMRKGILEFCILTLLSNEEMYSSDIINRLKGVRMIVVEGTMYPLLNRLKKASLLTYRWVESDSGPPRKYYQLTQKGELFLAELKETWKDLEFAVHSLMPQGTDGGDDDQD